MTPANALTSPHTAHAPRLSSWTVVHGTFTAAQLLQRARTVATQHGLALHHHQDTATLTRPDGQTVATLRWHSLPPQPTSTLGYQLSPPSTLEVLIEADPALAADLHHQIQHGALALDQTELDSITAAMPLVTLFSPPDGALDGWALLFRDHFLEHSLGFLLGAERAGIPPAWIYALDKGDQTHNRDRLRATFADRGYRTGLLDNAAINTPDEHTTSLTETTDQIDAFLDAAHEAGRRVLVVDDGGLLARGYGHREAVRQVDAAVELTVSGLKRIAAAGDLACPVLNMARSQVKTLLGYPEIADSCLRRLRALLPDRKVIGRTVVLLGYGTLGSRLAASLRAQGCRVEIVDTDLPNLLAAAESGYATHRTLAAALTATRPFLLIGTTGEDALTKQDLALLPDGAVLAPFATADFGLLSNDAYRQYSNPLPGVGMHYRLANDRSVVLLGDGRSANLFQADSIPTQGYDAYRAGTLIAAKHLCRNPAALPAGLHCEPADQAIADAGLFEHYYAHYYEPHQPPGTRHQAATSVREPRLRRACIIGYGTAGQLHSRILNDLGAEILVIDPKHQDLTTQHSFAGDVEQLPTHLADEIDLWTVSCPTQEHLRALRSVLSHNPAARILLEKPACQGHEITELTTLLREHPRARMQITDQYRHTRALPALTELLQQLAPDAAPDQITIAFTKNRMPDIAHGRFIDHTYGVLGYEWLHMLTVLRELVPADTFTAYLHSSPDTAELWADYDPDLFLAGLTERTTLLSREHQPTKLELLSSLRGPHILHPTTTPAHPEQWHHNLRPPDDRRRYAHITLGDTRIHLQFDPVTAGAWQLDRNHHRLVATRGDHVLHDEVLTDSPLDTAIRYCLDTLLNSPTPPSFDLAPLQRIATLADHLRGIEQQTPRD